MKVLIIEDEALASERLEKLLLDIDTGIEVMAKLPSVKKSIRWLMENKPELIFLDIQLSDGISFSIFEELSLNIPVIVTTAYDQYAIKAFELNSIAYLLKPVRKTELEQSIKKYKEIKSTFVINFESLMAEIRGEKASYKKRFLVQIGQKFKKIEAEDIAYFYSMEKSTYIKLFSGSSYPLDYSLDGLEKILDPEIFFRINRKYIIQMDSINEMYAWSRSRVKIDLKPAPDDDMDAIVSIDRASDFKKWMNS
jgi:DNA-binding LytR/AlgR family response regulator